MSAFFKRFKGGNQETVGKEPEDENRKDKAKYKNALNPPSKDSTSTSGSCDEGLSLFSGMTFSFVSSPEQPTCAQAEYRKPASKVLEEAGIDLNVKNPLTESSEQNVEPKLTSEKDTNEIDEEVELSQPTPLGSSAVQQVKKKKRTQAKRPGYARDAKNTTSARTTSIQSSERQQDLKEKQEVPSTLNTASTKAQEPKHHSFEDQTFDSNKAESLDQTHEDQSSLNGSENASEKVEDTPVVEGNQQKDFHQLYSINTPSSSEENLAEDDEAKQEETKVERMKHDEHNESENKQSLNDEDMLESDENDGDKNLTNLEKDVQDNIELNPQQKDNLNLEEKKLNEEYNVKHEYNDIEVEENLEKEDCYLSGINESNEVQEVNKSYDLSLDTEDKLILVKQDMQFRISSLSKDEETLSALRKNLLQNYSNSKNTYLEKQKELDNLIKEESSALTNDNYDLAEELTVKIEQAKEDLENARYKFPAVDIKVQEAISLASDLAFRTLSIHREAQVSLEELREGQVIVLDICNEENNVRMSKEKQQLNTERQRLDRAHAHLQLDTKHLQKEEILLEEEISGRTKEFVTRKKQLMVQQGQIREEIAELEERLLQLRLSESQHNEDIKAEELKIEEILEEFVPQREPLNYQRNDLENKRCLLDTQQEALASAQETFNKSVEEWNDRKRRLTDFLDSFQASISSNNSSISHLEKKRGELEEFQCLKHLSFKADAALDKLKLSTKRSSQQIKNLKNKLNLSNRNIASLRKRLTEIEAQISDRNEAKDIAKKERNFKEAKRLKEEGEALNVEGIESQKKLEDIFEELNTDTSLLKNAEKEFEKMAEELKEKEYESDLKLVNSAAQVVQALETQIHRYKDNEMLYTLLTAEISTCQNLIKELCPKHAITAPVLGETECLESDVQQDSSKEPAGPAATEDSTAHCECVTDDKDSLQSLLDELEGKLEAVVEMEDFDEAERIQQQIDELKSR